MTRWKSRSATKWLAVLFLLLVALVLVRCDATTPEPTPQATPGPQATATSSKPVATQAAESSLPKETIPPTEPPPPTITPLPLPPPRLLAYRPEPGQAQPLEAPIELTFDQPMDRDSVETALNISPRTRGDLTWADERNAAFTPASGSWERGEYYEITVSDRARNIEGTSMEEPVAFAFGTVGYLNVSEVLPAPDADELDPDTIITVIFDRPVVPLTAINRHEELPDPLTLIPPVRGEGEWLNTSIYLFRPEGGLDPATQYKARVAAGLIDTSGGVLDEDYVWEFATIRPDIVRISPENEFAYTGPTDVISVTFNQPMDHASAQAGFSLESEDWLVEGTFRWSGGETSLDPETMVFIPDDALPRETTFVARLASGILSAVGNMDTAEDRKWEFTTVNYPGIVSISPRHGSEDVDPERGVTIEFASPMQREGFLDHLTIQPQVTDVYTYWAVYDTEVSIYFPKDPQATYSVSVDDSAPDKYGATLGEAGRARFATGDLRPVLSLHTNGRLGTFSAYTDTILYATHRNLSRLDVSLYELSPEAFTRLNTNWTAWDEFEPDQEERINHWALAGDTERNKAHLLELNLTDGTGGRLPPGLYYLEMSAPEIEEMVRDYRPSRYMFVKSGLNVTLKQTRGEALVWATDLSSGQPVSDLPVTFYLEDRPLSVGGKTDTDGLSRTAVGIEDLWESFFAFTGGPGEEDFGLAYNRWDSGISPWDFDVSSEFWSNDYQGYLYTDRPIYRPGQTVYFKGIVRADDDAHYSLPADIDTLEVQVDDPQGKELYKEELPLSDMGTLFDELVLSEEAPLGSYYIELRDRERGLWTGTSFLVAEYRKPEYQVAVTPDRDAYLNGDTINVTAEATYYFGGPVANAEVHWSVLSADHWFRYQCPQGQSCPWYSWTDYEWSSHEQEPYYGSYGRLIAEGDAQTDDEGRVTFRLPADIAQETSSQRFTIEVSVTDVNGQLVSNRTAAIVHKGEFYTGVAPRGYLAQVGEDKEIDILAADWDSEAVVGKRLTVVFMEHRWYSVRRQAEDGNFYWDWVAEDTPVLTTTVATDDAGQALATFTPPKAGSYRVRVTGRDRRGNEIRSSAYFWVWGGSEFVRWRRESNNRVSLVADKDEYQVGDVAEILIPSPYDGPVKTLLTIERGHVMQAEVRELETNSHVLYVPITEDSVPNMFVSVILVQGSESAPDSMATFKMGVVKLPVSTEAKELSITLAPDKDMETGEHYGPRQTATYDVLVTDHEGEPVEAELSLRLADLAVLALADESGPTLMERFWRDRGLGVKTSASLVVAMEAFNRELKPKAKGGGGGGDGDGLIRTRFADTAFWDPVVRTDKDGKAQVTVQLPDNLTTWRMQARGITAHTEVGRAEVDILSSLDLLVRPVLPRFLVAGDKVEIATIVHNNTEETLEAQVNINVEGLALEGDSQQTVRVEAGDKAKVVWPVEALPGDQVKLRMWATAADLYDGREDTLPVYHYSTPEVVATAGHLEESGTRQEIIQLPSVFDPSQGELTVQIDGSLTAGTQDALDYLEHYPYECVEQTVSRFLPNVVTWRALDEMDVERPELRQKLSQMVGVGLQRLYNQQHYDGGWGWWATDDSNPYLTAYVLQGMLEAYRAGFVVDERVMEKAIEFLWEELPSVDDTDNHWEANRLAYELYVLAEYDTLLDSEGEEESASGGALGLANRLYKKRRLLDNYGKATLAVALSLLDPEEKGRVRTLVSDLTGDAVVSATGTHWQEDVQDYWNMNTDVRTTAIVLWALARLEPDSDLLPSTVRWLMSTRQEGYWQTTQGTAWSLLGLVQYMQASGELKGDYSYSVYLNGHQWASGDVSPETIDESHRLQVEIAQLLVDQGNRLVIERLPAGPGQTGKGILYYTAQLRYYLPADHVQALDRGIIVARQYTPVDNPGDYVDSAQVGDVIRVKLTIIAPTNLHYLVVEDPLPAGFEGVDLSLKTSSVVGEAPSLQDVSAEEEHGWYRWYGWGWWWFSHSEMRDEKIALFANYLPRGTYEYTYLMRASVPGEYHVMPATAYQMYFPDVFGRSDGAKFTISPAD